MSEQSAAANRRKQNQTFAFFLMTLVTFLFIAILVTLVFGDLKPEVNTAVEQWGTAIIAIVGTAAAYEWGSSKGSAMKDEIAAQKKNAEPLPPNSTIDSTTSTTIKT